MEKERNGPKILPQNKNPCRFTLTKLLPCLSILFPILILLYFQASPSTSSSPSSSSSSSPYAFFSRCNTSISHSKVVEALTAKLRDSVTFLPLKDLRFSDTPMTGNTWFMSSLANTHEENEAGYLYFPSNSSRGRILCIKGSHRSDGTKNSYALAWPEALPASATLLQGLTFVSNTYYDHNNIWHGLCAIAPFVSWSMDNQCLKPLRWVLFHWGELRTKMGAWVWNLTKTKFGDVEIKKFEETDRPYCFEKAVVMRRDLDGMGAEKKHRVFDLLRCKAREACGLNPLGRGREVDERGVPIIRLTLLMRKGSRSFKNGGVVKGVFGKECERVEGCVLTVVHSDNLSFCDQVRVLTNTDILASPHGAQQTNMLFMDRGSSVMEFFPKGWLEHAGIGQYVYHWMANQSGMKHRGAWWDPIGEECPSPKNELECFLFHKDGRVGHNETYFAEWARTVLDRVRESKMEQASKPQLVSSACECTN